MRTIIAMLSVILFALGYGVYLWIVSQNIFTNPGITFGIKSGLLAFIFTVLTCMSLSWKTYFELAWLQTGILFVSIILFWRSAYDFGLVGDITIPYLIYFCIATALVSIIFFYNAVKYGMHKQDD